MDKISVIKKRILKSSNKKSLNYFKEHVLKEIFSDISLEDALVIPISKLIEIKNEYLNSKLTKQVRAYSIEFYTVRGWSESDAIDHISELQRTNSLKFSKKRKNNPEKYSHMKSPMTIGFWTSKGYSISDAEKQIKAQRPVSIEHWLKKGYSEAESKKLISSFQSKMSNKFKKKKHENPEQYQSYSPTQIGYWLKKGYSENEAKKLVSKRQTTFTLDKCIEKYGKEEGIKIFNKRQTKWKKSLQENFEREGDGRSPSSKFANSIIKELCSYLKIEIHKKEKWIKCKETGNAYSYDFTYKKKIIEFNGDYWHCNPKLYEVDYFHKNKGLTAKEIWEYDNEKNKLAEQHGYEVFTIWESDWMENPKQTIDLCIKFLNK